MYKYRFKCGIMAESILFQQSSFKVRDSLQCLVPF